MKTLERTGNGRAGDAAPERWVRAGLMTEAEAAAIERFERGRAEGRSSLLSEVLVYVGGIAILGGLAALVGTLWDRLGFGSRLGIFGALTAVMVAAGAALLRSASSAQRRAASASWALGVAALGGTGAIVADQLGWSDAATTLAVGIPAWALSLVLHRVHRHGLQLAAVHAAWLVTVLGTATALAELGPAGSGWVMAGAGAAMLALAFAGVATPVAVGQALGAGTVLFGLFSAGTSSAWGEATGLAVSALFLWWSVAGRSGVLLAAGAAGAFAFLTQISVRHFAETVGMPIALLVSGVVLVGAGVAVARMRPLIRRTPARGEKKPEGARR